MLDSNNHNKTSTNGGILPETFSYEGLAARLMTLQEAQYGCNETSHPLDKCMFFLENTRFSDETATKNFASYFETVEYNSTYAAFTPGSFHRDYSANNVYPHGDNYIRPTIELPLSDIDY